MDAIVTAALEPGRSFPLGASLVAGGANFSVLAKRASAVQLLLFDTVDDERPWRVVDLTGRTHHYRHTFVPNVKAGRLYAYRAHGRYAPEQGLPFEADKILLDPYGKCIARCRTDFTWNERHRREATIAVEMHIATHPPHRTERARFAHSAPTLGV